MTAVATEPHVRAASLSELRSAGRLVVHVDRHTICLFADGDEVHAVDNRCPHMGFPLHRGTLCDGILTCHWHHARFDLSTGGTFDQWADDLRRFPVELRGDDVLVDLSRPDDVTRHQRKRLHDGLEREIPLVPYVHFRFAVALRRNVTGYVTDTSGPVNESFATVGSGSK